MKIINETELMTNQKASMVIVPDKQFEALQTVEGNSLVFSISTDNVLYCTREVPGDTHGWVKVDLSSSLSAACYGGAAIAAETFDIAQDMTANTQSVDIALVVKCGGKDYLHLVTGFKNTFENWTSGAPVFKADSQFKFDYPGENIPSYQAMPINGVQIVDSNDGNATQYIIVDLVSNPATQTTSRFYIDNNIDSRKKRGYAWLPHDLSGDLTAGKITTFIGCGPNDGPDSYPGAGDGAGNNIGGAYVLGSVAGTPQLQYTPAYNFNHPEETPDPTVINFPAGTNDTYMAMDVSSSAANAPYTDLFFATNGQLYFLACADQNDSGKSKPVPVSIYTHDLFQNIQSLHVKNWNDNIVIWGQSLDPADMQTSRLFIMEGVAGQETNAAAWSTPIPLLFNVVNSSAYVNNIHSLDSKVDTNNGNAYGSCSVLFAEQVITDTSNNKIPTLTQLFQDPVTTAWQVRSLLTEPAAENVITEMYETTTYSSHIEIADDNNVAMAFVPVYAWASSPCTVYVTDANNTAAYLPLDPQKPLPLNSDPAGHVTIMQPVDTIGGISYYIAVQDPTTKQWYKEVINPLTGTISKLNTNVPDGTGDHLSGVQVTDEWNTKTKLITNSSLNGTQTTAQSNNIYAMCQQNKNVNADGLTSDQVKAGGWPDPAKAVAALEIKAEVADLVVTSAAKQIAPGKSRHAATKFERIHVKKFAKADRQFKDIRFNPETDTIWGCTFGKNAKHYYGIDAVKEMGLVVKPDGSLAFTSANGQVLDSGNTIEAKAGHLFKWLKSEVEKVEHAVITYAEGVIDCVLTIAGNFYHFVVKCANDIANAAHAFLNAVETAFADLVKWLGSIFAWMDILRTHSAFKSLFTNYMNYAISQLGTLETTIDGLFEQVETNIDKWAGLPTDSYSGQQSNNSGGNGQKNPSSHWANHHIKNNATNASVAEDAAEAVLDDLITVVNNEYGIITDAVSELQAFFNDPNSPVKSKSVTDIVEGIVGIMANTVLKSANNLFDGTIEVAEVMLEGVTDLITAPLHIPVLSNLYSTFTKGSQLSYLDLACLAAAVPTTVIYKLANGGKAPFPQGDADSDAIIAATSLEEIAELCFPSQVSADAGLQYNPWPGGLYNRINFCCNLAASIGGIGVTIVGFMKTKLSQQPEPPQKAISVLSKLYAVCYLPYIAPDIGGALQYIKKFSKGWYDDLSALLGIFGLAKTLADLKWSTATAQNPPLSPPGKNTFTLPFGKMEDGTNKKFGWYEISPLLETVINLVWEIPVVFQYVNSEKKTNDILSLTANTCFNASGVLTPFVSWTTATVQLVFAGIGGVLNIGYGVLSGFWALDCFSDN